jgi:hypothetical protein
MKTFKIEIPDGHEIDYEASTFEKIVFKPIKVKLPKTWDESGLGVGIYGGQLGQANTALRKLSLLRDIYRGDWKPNWCDEGEQKYCIGFQAGSIVATIHIVSCQFLSFQSAKVRDEFFDNFIDLIRDAEPFMS